MIARLFAASAIVLAGCSGDQSKSASGRPDGSGDGAADVPLDGARPGVVDGGGGGGSGDKVAGGGSLTVVASLPSAGASAMTSPGRNACGAATRPAVEVFIRDRTETVTGLVHALVEIEGIEGGRALPEAAPVEVEIRDCGVRPVVARASRVGASLALINGDERRQELAVDYLGADGSSKADPIARVPLPLVGQRVEVPLARAGIVRITAASDERDHSYVFVPAHPYAAVTDATGAAHIDGIPPGSYQVRVWHPPLERGGKPLVARVAVTIDAGKSVEQVIALEVSR